ncbi:MAG: cell division protein FtsZ [Nitrospirae bacterium]|nr:cell division protein FtsZ [Nitrospirota bacterium]MCL5977297.1 cell division protein FtsZ [Nitrospirota bacterium]
MFELAESESIDVKIKVIGGGGENAVNSMIAAGLSGIDFIAIDTNIRKLENSAATTKVQIGTTLTRGLGAGAKPVIGQQAAIEGSDFIRECLKNADMVFITAGMGGGTGAGAAPVVAGIAKEMGILTIAVVTKPFYYEGRTRALNAEAGIKELKKNVDAYIVIPNDKIHLSVPKGTSLIKSFDIANDILRQAIQSITDLLLIRGHINHDFADIKAIMEKAGRSVMGIGYGKAEEGGAIAAVKQAIANPLLEDSSIEGARGILLNITGGADMPLHAVQDAASVVNDLADDNANIILGIVINPSMKDNITVTIIATGFDEKVEALSLAGVSKWTPNRLQYK